jgi:hypothetical protein
MQAQQQFTEDQWKINGTQTIEYRRKIIGF